MIKRVEKMLVGLVEKKKVDKPPMGPVLFSLLLLVLIGR